MLSLAHIIGRELVEMAEPLPNINKFEIGVLTLEEFYELRNPSGWEIDEIGEESVQSLNPPEWRRPDPSSNIHYSTDSRWIGVWNTDEDADVGWKYIYDTIKENLYYQSDSNPQIPFLKQYQVAHAFPFKSVLDIEDFIIDPKMHLDKYTVVLQHIKIGERMTVRASKDTQWVAVFNQDNFIVGRILGTNSTILEVAKEYKGKGLGTILGKIWYQLHPTIESGGYSRAGKKNAAIMWADRVREFLANGWYTELIRQGKITKEKVSKIQSDLKTIRSGKYRPLAGL